MLYKNKLEIPLAKDCVLKTLSRKAQSSAPGGYVQGAKFCLYITALHSGNRTASKYVFKGYVDDLAEGSAIHYSLRPTMLTIIVLCINFSLLVKGVIQYIAGANNIIFLLISLLANVLAVLFVMWQEKQCVQRFESLFRQEDGFLY